MAKWEDEVKCVNGFRSHLDNEEAGEKRVMLPKVTILIVLFSGITLAYLSIYIPNVTRLIANASFGFGDSELKSKEISNPSVLIYKKHLEDLQCDTVTKTSLLARSKKVLEKKEEVKTEALAALKLAVEMKEHGKHEKALKLFEHALALDPTHADILNEYGEFLENQGENIIKAEHMYYRAIAASPQHSKAMANRQRTLPLVQEIDQAQFNRIEKKREMFFRIPENHPGLRRMKKESYIHHIYHTVALEGNTMTLSQTRSVVENRMAIAGKSIMEHNEVLGLDLALSYINSTLVQKIGKITLNDILEIHKRVLGFVDPVEAGHIRSTQVYVGHYIPPAASDVSGLMEEFTEWLNSDVSMRMHPVELGALAHYKLVLIHPFYDGNGRTARLLMNLILMHAGYPPIIIPVGEKHLYYQHIETASEGDVRPFIRFIASILERTLDDYLLSATKDYEGKLSLYREQERVIIVDP
ncbi:adenosine monophosphate-protein transferase FICD homolog [Lingula anatina]|uniref:protein adenylyltransferase n=1 Tax=Lingula anatina TaxID=7574 RepID=A0A1S3I2C2_LINAN|nr:adenosine monophosphate-protein transferase FICD homolog [Lingula anatina]|eukprot:XP_013391494.1 adenosine monophosphate-protein transferase FICD homolog [Lingula anatina]